LLANKVVFNEFETFISFMQCLEETGNSAANWYYRKSRVLLKL